MASGGKWWEVVGYGGMWWDLAGMWWDLAGIWRVSGRDVMGFGGYLARSDLQLKEGGDRLNRSQDRIAPARNSWLVGH